MREWNVPGYTELKALGSGGFGDVVLARHDTSGTLVAIKYLRPDLLADPQFTVMFRAEAATLAAVADPNIVRLYEYAESPSGAAIVMELVDGVSLREVLARQGKTTAEAALVVLQGSLLGLAAAHRHGVVHRDYKPANVLINGEGASKLTDFGIAARTGDRPVPAGTLAYAAPEQIAGAPASPASDVYAATATFYECLTGHPPFSGDTAEALLRQHQSDPVSLDPVPEPLRPLVAAGMAKEPGRRPADASILVTQLAGIGSAAYGPDWADRGRSHLGEAALLLALLWPSSAPPAAQGSAVEQVRLSRGAQKPRNPEHLRHVEHLRHLDHIEHVEHLQHEHAEHLRHLEHLQHEHIEHLEHVEHLEHLEHAGHSLPGHSGPSTPAAAPGAKSAAQARRARALRQGRHGLLAGRPAAVIIAAAVGVTAIAATATATTIGSGHSAPSIVGAWNDNEGSTFTFTSSGPGAYTVSLVSKDAPQCAQADDGTVTGSNGHYQGSINLYQQGGGTAGACDPKVGVAQIAITLAANSASASVNLIGNDCPTCKPQIWTR
jgi:serine/threonine protein kinase